MNKYLPYIIAIAMFLLGYLIAPGDKVDVSQYEREREGYERQITHLKRQQSQQDSISEAIREKMSIDSAFYADALKRKEITIAKLRNDIEKTDYRNFSADGLDSVRAVILSRAR
jgi:hypothetical protein